MNIKPNVQWKTRFTCNFFSRVELRFPLCIVVFVDICSKSKPRIMNRLYTSTSTCVSWRQIMSTLFFAAMTLRSFLMVAETCSICKAGPMAWKSLQLGRSSSARWPGSMSLSSMWIQSPDGIIHFPLGWIQSFHRYWTRRASWTLTPSSCALNRRQLMMTFNTQLMFCCDCHQFNAHKKAWTKLLVEFSTAHWSLE